MSFKVDINNFHLLSNINLKCNFDFPEGGMQSPFFNSFHPEGQNMFFSEFPLGF